MIEQKTKCKLCNKSVRKWTVSLDFKRFYHRTCYKKVERNNYYNKITNLILSEI